MYHTVCMLGLPALVQAGIIAFFHCSANISSNLQIQAMLSVQDFYELSGLLLPQIGVFKHHKQPKICHTHQA